VITVTEVGGRRAATMSRGCMQAPALSVRRANRNATRATELRDNGPGHGAAAGPQGPTGRRQRPKTNRRRPRGRALWIEVHAMMTKLRDKIERIDALKGWRMRWYMQ